MGSMLLKNLCSFHTLVKSSAVAFVEPNSSLFHVPESGSSLYIFSSFHEAELLLQSRLGHGFCSS